MQRESLPKFILNSAVLSSEDIDKLCEQANLPTDDEVDQIRIYPEIQELLQAFIGDEHTRDIHVQLKAKSYLAQGDVAMAWRVLML